MEDAVDQPRKRQRTESMNSASSGSNKRAASSPPQPQDVDIDEYMAAQDADDPQRFLGDFRQLCVQSLAFGDTWYLVSKKWHKKFIQAFDPASKEKISPTAVGPVDNADLFVEHRRNGEQTLRRPLHEGVDFIYVPEKAWQALQKRFGQSTTLISREVASRGSNKELFIEINPYELRVFRLVKEQSETNGSTPLIIILSLSTSVRSLCSHLGDVALPSQSPEKPRPPYRVWNIKELSAEDSDSLKAEITVAALRGKDPEIVDESDKTLEDSGVMDGDNFVVECKADDKWLLDSPTSTSTAPTPAPLFQSGAGFFDTMHSSATKSTAMVKSSPRSSSPAFGASSRSSTLASDGRTAGRSIEPGTLGLGNLGNTCFMNSALQCLAHTRELMEYFLVGVYKKELNPDNPLGMQGAIAEAFGALLQRIWADTSVSTSYYPREFKTQLARFAPQFSGYQQQDSQELVAFLLDGLHEDLNRVLKKPYVEKPDWPDGVSDADKDTELVKLAQTSWDGYMRRNDSVIVDLFQGQYQSTLVCPECSKVSITFDPFMYLTLPLPIQKKWRHDVFYIPWDTEKPHVKIPVEIRADASFKELRQMLGRWMNTPSDHLITLEIWSNKFYKSLDDYVTCGEMANNDTIVCFELPCPSQQSRAFKRKPGDPFICPVYLSNGHQTYKQRANSYSNNPLFGYPMLVAVSEEESRSQDDIYDAVVKRLERWTSAQRDLFNWDVVEEIKLNGGPPETSITEITETGEVRKVQDAPEEPDEGDIVDEKAMKLDEADLFEEIGPRLQTKDPVRLGPKRNIFEIKLQSSQKSYNSNPYSYQSHTSSDTLDKRKEEASDTSPSLLRDGDILICEFDENMKAYYFGEDGRFENALWNKWEEFRHPEYEEALKSSAGSKGKGVSLQDCLDEFTKEEKLGEDDLWYCPRCKKHQQATKKFDLWKAPDVLVVHLKRFSNSRMLRDKIDAFIDFPIEGLDLGSMVGEREVGKRLAEHGEDVKEFGIDVDGLNEPLVYDLFGVDEHIGGLGGGHYRAYAMNHLTEKWYHFDDSIVTPARATDSVNANAYLLFYRRRTSTHLGGQTYDKIQEAKSAVASDTETSDSSMDTAPEDPPPFEPSGNSLSNWPLPPTSQLDDTRLYTMSETSWNNSDNSNIGSSNPTPPSDGDDLDYRPPDALAESNSTFDFPNPSSTRASPTSSVGAQIDSDREMETFDYDPRDDSLFSVSVQSPTDSPRYTSSNLSESYASSVTDEDRERL